MKKRTLLCSVATVALCSVADAQTDPAFRNIDANGVDITSGELIYSTTDVRIGPDSPIGLRFDSEWRRSRLQNNFDVYAGYYGVVINGISYGFNPSGGGFVSQKGDGSSYSHSSSTSEYIFTSPTGVVYTFDSSPLRHNYDFGSLKSIVYPDGVRQDYYYKFAVVCIFSGGCAGYPISDNRWGKYRRLQSIVTNGSYQLKMEYATNTTPTTGASADNWVRLTKVIGINNQIEACSPTADTCTLSYTWPAATYAYSVSSGTESWVVTDPLSRVTTYQAGPGAMSIKEPGRSAANISASIDSNGRLSSLTRNGVTWAYDFADSGFGSINVTATDPLSNQWSYTTATSFFTGVTFLFSSTNPLGKSTLYDYDAESRLVSITYPEGNARSYTYDSRGNITQTTTTAKTGSGLAAITTTASFAGTCSSSITCNLPTSSTDGMGQQTDYAYSSATGQVTSITSPAPAPSAPRPETRFAYATTNGVSLLSGVSTCQTTSSCLGTTDEVKTAITYNANLLPATVTKQDGTGSLSSTSSSMYNNYGDLASFDGALGGSSDTTFYRFDLARQRVGVVTPDPDGSGTLKRRAVRLSYNSEGQLNKEERGTVNGTSDADWSAFVPLQEATSDYDPNGRLSRQSASSSGATYAVTDRSYDAVGRAECVAYRMNPAAWSTATGACSLQTTGGFGSDRIAKTSFDAASRVTKIQTAYGVPGTQADDVSSTYTDNGRLASVTDGEGNRTTYEYDGHDRLFKTRYPNVTQGSGTSSTSDYEELAYNANSIVVSQRLRDASSIAFGYDNMSRLVTKDLPGSEPDVSLSYDLLNRLTSATQPGRSLSFAYDALSRLTTEGSPQGSLSYQYDAAGQRQRVTWPDAFYVSFDRLTTGEVSVVRENGATSGAGVLASFSYDDLGARIGVARGNSTATAYSRDAMSRLSGLTHDFAGTASDFAATYTYNPAGQIAGLVQANDVYAFDSFANTNLTSAVNGLNQITSIGTTSITYDARGNTISIGSATYGYNSQNQMTSGGGGSIAYDALLRLSQLVSSGTTHFQYSGDTLAAEYDTSSLIRRFIFEPDTLEPLVWYEGSSTADRRWLYADERKSVVAVGNGSATATAINRYDEFGIPSSLNSGRFQFAGVPWIPVVGTYSYKARMYSPSLGRFMQPDPQGMQDGTNLYAYVRNDPINLKDNLGLQASPNQSTFTSFGSILRGTEGVNPDEILVTGQFERFNSFFSGLATMTYGPAELGILAASVDLNFLEKALVKATYRNNATVRNNINRIIRRLSPTKLTDKELESVFNDILNGDHTEVEGLKRFAKIDANNPRFTGEQVELLKLYIRDLPPSALNQRVQQAFANWLSSTKRR